MKSNQERSNECLPPKKREILALEERQVLVASTVNESQSSENLAWLASVASMANMATVPNLVPSQSKTPHLQEVSLVLQYQPARLSSPLTFLKQQGPIQTTHLPSNLQIIGPYTSYFSSQVVPAASSPTQSRRPTQEVYATTAVIPQTSSGNPQKQHVLSSLPTVTHTTSQCIQVDGTPVGLPVPASQVPIQLHTHSTVLAPHGLTLAPSQVLVHYADGLITKQPETQSRDLQNGTLGEVTVVKHTASIVKDMSNKPEMDNGQRQIQSMTLPAQTQVLLPADYNGHDSARLQTSVMLVSSNHMMANNSNENYNAQNKEHASLVQVDRTRLSVGKPVSRVSSLCLPSSDSMVTSFAPTLPPHSLLHTSPSGPTQELSTNLFSSTQLPIIGYIASTSGPPQQAVASYHSNLPQHLVISGSPSLFIPVSAGNINTSSTDSEVTRCFIPSISSTNVSSGATGLPQTYITAPTPTFTTSILPNGKEVKGPEEHIATAGVQSSQQVQLPVLSAGVVAPPAPVISPTPTSSQNAPLSPSSALPPYFMKGSIIQLADGELKRVEDLKTEDFLLSAEVSTELKIDSSTVERIDSSRTPNAVIIQFSVGEHKAQVCVEVLVEYPFFVFGQGWSSCCPDRTTQLLALSCAKLSVGDVCISLTLKSLRNGALQKDQTFGPVKNLENSHHKKAKTIERTVKPQATREDQIDGSIFRLQGEEKFGGVAVKSSNSGNSVIMSKNAEGKAPCAGSRKRRWSAPEKGEMGRSQENECTETLPKLSFLTQELKVSIEGRIKTLSDKSKEAKVKKKERYEETWVMLHKRTKECAKAAEVVDGEMVMLSAHWERRRGALIELQEQLQQIPSFLTDLESITAQLGQLESSFQEMESNLTYLENLCGQCELKRFKHFQILQLENYKKKKRKELESLKAELDAEHAQKVLEIEHAQQAKLKERQKYFEEAFQQDMEQYLSTGYLRITDRRACPIGSMSSMEVNVDMLEQMDLTDVSDHEALDVFLNSAADESSRVCAVRDPDVEISLQVPSHTEVRPNVSSVSSSCTDSCSGVTEGPDEEEEEEEDGSDESSDAGQSPLVQCDEEEVQADTTLVGLADNEEGLKQSDDSDTGMPLPSEKRRNQ
ncbi:Dysbindin-A [Bagarius yarrelli]|uniref:Dysbindin-A n=1 Tax=Bagarius yarrelli TaxID=175774 RepID=A0A556VUF9_BAGYA|nr:Dysbindin-A [Bagarius yarrelli]